MNGPDDRLRSEVVARMDGIAGDGTDDPESELSKLLADIDDMIAGDAERSSSSVDRAEAATNDLGAVQAWASLASYAVTRLYMPTRSWRPNFAGYATAVCQWLQKIVNRLRAPLDIAAAALGAVTYSIGVQFPWAGIQISIEWAVNTTHPQAHQP